ncbi:hypothetical protein ACHAXS_006285 [Conticribra weissflogii]
MDLPIEETNLAGIGSDEDKAARQAAAKMDFNWEGAGTTEGIEIWRVENKRDENDNPDFGIAPWPKKKYGQFHRGDSYIVLLTSKDGEDLDGGLMWDIFFWIGSESSQDEYGVAAYKANELDDLLGSAPVQHREIEGNESDDFVKCFPKGITYLEGGIDSGFRNVSELDGADQIKRLYKFHKGPKDHAARCSEVPLKCSSLNDGDAFLLDCGNKIYTWFGSSVSPFEKSKSASVAHNLRQNRLKHCECILDVGNDDEAFWALLGGKGEIKPADDEKLVASSKAISKKMFSLSDESGSVQVKEVSLSKSNLDTNDVYLVDIGNNVYIWVGKGSSKVEQQQAMIIVNRYLRAMDRSKTTRVSRVIEGQERRCRQFLKVF